MNDKQDQERTGERPDPRLLGAEFVSRLPPSPRVWSLPAEPGPEVTAVRDGYGNLWQRDSDAAVAGWTWDVHVRGWLTLLADAGPLADASDAIPEPTITAWGTSDIYVGGGASYALVDEARASVALDGETQTFDEGPTP